MLTGRRYRLERTTLALGDTDGNRKAVPIPLGTVIKVVSGPNNGDGMVDVLFDGRILAMFEVDLRARGTEIEEPRNGDNLSARASNQT